MHGIPKFIRVFFLYKKYQIQHFLYLKSRAPGLGRLQLLERPLPLPLVPPSQPVGGQRGLKGLHPGPGLGAEGGLLLGTAVLLFFCKKNIL